MSAPSERELPSVVAIDGPAGAGKSTVSRQLAQRLGFFLLDTGAIYRAVALVALERGLELSDAEGLAAVARTLHIRFVERDPSAGEDGPQRVLLDDRDVTHDIRTPQVSDASSRVSSVPAVREALLELQRAIARRGGCVVEGRDIGTVVLPWAPVKFFLTASVDERARRRHEELLARGAPSDLEATRRDIVERDRRDESRATAPLRRPDDAVDIDTSAMSIGGVVDRMEAVARARLGAGKGPPG